MLFVIFINFDYFDYLDYIANISLQICLFLCADLAEKHLVGAQKLGVLVLA